MSKSKSKKHKVTLISRIILFLLVVISVIFFSMVLSTGVLPTKYLLMILIPYGICLLVGAILQWKESIKSSIKWTMNVFSIFSILALSFGIFYMYKTFDFMGMIEADKYQTEEFYMMVLKDSKVNSLSDLKSQTVGIYPVEQDSYKSALTDMKGKLNATYKEYQNFNKLGEELLGKKIPAIFVSASQKDTLIDEVDGFEAKTKIINTTTQKIKNEVVSKEVKVTEQPFNIYISGIDIYGSISSVSRSDVNIIVTVNPETHKILLTSIPRDYYVALAGKTGYKDKLTHAGVYGIDNSIKTLENLLDIDVNYYVRVNFTTLISLVDAIGGVDINSQYSFVAASGDSFKAGMNHMNGELALAYSRERHAFSDGDRQRGKNQQQVLSAILNKTLSSKTLITRYTNILGSLKNSFQTNIETSKIYSLVNMQLDSMPKWTIETYNLDGTGASELTYSYPHQKLYVMVPNATTVTTAKAKIDAIEKGA